MSEERFDGRLDPRGAGRQLDTIGRLAVEGVKERLKSRGVKPRSGEDDRVFAQFNTSLSRGLHTSFGKEQGSGLASYYFDIFHEVDWATQEFEERNATEVHKGSIYFNMAVLCLHTNDFDRALYFFHAADQENQKTHGHPSAELFASAKVFKVNVTNRLHMLFNREYQDDRATLDLLVGGHPTNTGIDQVLLGLPIGHFSSFIVTSFRYVVTDAFRESNDGARTLYHRLLTDFCHCFESGLKAHTGRKGGTLGGVLLDALKYTAVGDISAEIKRLRPESQFL